MLFLSLVVLVTQTRVTNYVNNLVKKFSKQILSAKVFSKFYLISDIFLCD